MARIISVVGKVDARAIVYPMARALSMNGLTCVIADDGAYRRLYHGKGDIGTVNGIDIGVVSHVNEDNYEMLRTTGIPYDNIIVVSTDFIPDGASGIVVCHGLDRSILSVQEQVYDDDPDIPSLKENNEDTENGEEAENSEETTDDSNSDVTESELEYRKKLEREQEENPDRIVVDETRPFVEVQIAFAAAPKNKNIIGISLKEAYYQYIFNCEERKRIDILSDKDKNSVIAKIISKVTDIPESEALKLLNRDEVTGEIKKKGK